MDDARKTREQLLAELDVLRRRVADLEGAAVEHVRTAQRLVKDVRVLEATLQWSEATARALLESASEGILVIDATGHIVLMNAAVERIFGFARAELLGQTLEILLPERIRDAHVGHRADYFDGPRVRPMGIGLDLAGQRKDGTEFPVEISLSYVHVPEGTVAMAFITDITERKRGEAELQRQRAALFKAEKLAALGTLPASIAHEMNNPLGIITTRLELMLLEAEEQRLPAPVVDDLHVLHRASQRVARIGASLRAFARQSPGERGRIDLNAVVDESVRLMQKPLITKGIGIVTNLDRMLPPMLGDAATLQQVLMNLLTNARDAMAGGGEIRIETRPVPERPGWIRLTVMDTGGGIPAEALTRVFDPFYTTKPTGMGLGLSVSYGIVQEHQGTMEVQLQLGEGTTFMLTFPAVTTRGP